MELRGSYTGVKAFRLQVETVPKEAPSKSQAKENIKVAKRYGRSAVQERPQATPSSAVGAKASKMLQDDEYRTYDTQSWSSLTNASKIYR